MILWFIVGFIVWALCVLFTLALFKAGNTTHGYEQKLHYSNMVSGQKVRNSTKEAEKRTALTLHN